MSDCRAIRWQLSRFLDGACDDAEDEAIRSHLDRCGACAQALIHPSRVERLRYQQREQLGADFTQRVLSEFPLPKTTGILFRYLCVAFFASAGLAVTIFAFIRNYLTPADLPTGASDGTLAQSLQQLFPWFGQLIAMPVVQYSLFVIAATILCLLVMWGTEIHQLMTKRRAASPR